jgi:hypothetical protein
MKIKRNCLFFNAETGDGGRTPDWGQELGQGKGYLMKEDGCSEIINGLVYNQTKDIENFSYGSGGRNYQMEIISIFENIEIKVYDFETKVHNKHKIEKPFVLIIAKETQGTHIGRRTLKMNKGFSYNNISNNDFYTEINKVITNPWFGYKLNYDYKETGTLTLTIIKAPLPKPNANNPDIIYETAKIRKDIWNDLIDEYSEQYDSINILNESSLVYYSGKLKPKNKIYYGAPGTGKSHKVKEIVEGKEEKTERVTFHPEYDYAAFVGGYKPKMNGDNIRYEFVPQAFTNIYTKAWNDLNNDYYLVIEEINRGNCAEIFGDIFQLLDRTNDYKITPSEELKEYLEIKLYGNNNINAEKLLLPPNLNILATMNTSDQSLFPMDSAFKRRWDWEYIPINYSREEDKNSSAKFVVKISDDESFKWLDFIESVNSLIKANDNLGMDKCLGNYFIKPESNIIEIETFINKALFYLWNDVFKDEMEEHSIFKDKTTYEDFFPIKLEGINKVKEILQVLQVDLNPA